MTQAKWEFWIDRGGTFTDLVARDPQGDLHTHKLLSENAQQYPDAAIQGIRDLLKIEPDEPLPSEKIAAINMGTTVATNALLERRGTPTLLVTTRGFADGLRIGYQTRPDLFALDIELPQMLYSQVIEIDERIDAHGKVLSALDIEQARQQLATAYATGLRACAIVFMHAYRYPDHEQQVAELARNIGYTQISVSSEVSPLMKWVSRGDTTVVDAYLSPILRHYVNQVIEQLPQLQQHGGQLLFMQSSGGLSNADFFQGKDAILSGPAGGVVGMVHTAKTAGFEKLIGFDMGGTSTDVSHYAGEYERSFETQIAGVRIRAPMMLIHTVAAGGGSIVHFDGSRYRVGPDSAGANPGPACYRNGGPLTITDCNVMLGKLQAEYFPQVFGANANQAIDTDIVKQKFHELSKQILNATGKQPSVEEIANGFLTIAVENMANAIKRISVQRGYDVSDYSLCCFGGAGGQHACLVADNLGIKKVYLHPQAGVLSAYGMGLADRRLLKEQSVEAELNTSLLDKLDSLKQQLSEQGEQEMLAQVTNKQDTKKQGANKNNIQIITRLLLRYAGSDTTLTTDFNNIKKMLNDFAKMHKQRFGFIPESAAVIVESIQLEIIVRGLAAKVTTNRVNPTQKVQASSTRTTVMNKQPQQTPFYLREKIPTQQIITGPAVIIERTSTVVLEPGWQARITDQDDLILQRYQPLPTRVAIGTQVDPVMLEIFNNLFMSIAEQMGTVLENTAVSVNIKERLDFSCALFSAQGDLVANAPHMPVHLGSMSESIKTIIRENAGEMSKGDAFLLNAPYNGGTHLPDVTVIKPVFDTLAKNIIFYVATRGHHADIGGITPGSMPPDSQHVEQEGVLLNNIYLVKQGRFCETQIREILASGKYPARNIDTNIADFKAQLAACEKGMHELLKIVQHYGLEVVHAYMQYVQDNAEESVRRVLDALTDGEFCYAMDDGHQIQVSIRVDKNQRTATVDFTGTSAQHPQNYNAPSAIAKAAVLYVFRCLVQDDIPLNEGCLKPLNIILPENSMVNPKYPAAVVAGNVETSQYLVDTLFGALGIMAASQGTMNNFTWGNQHYQYYETLCGGAGATKTRAGTSAVHTHMTNSRLTDPEILEWRYPVLLESFSIRKNSGGNGHHPGGDGVVRRVRFNDCVTANILAGHRKIPPYGLEGGTAGKVGRNYVEKINGNVIELGSQGQVEIQDGDVFVIETPGGGGYGKKSS